MPYRTFADDQGRSWEIWDVRPERIDRRTGERRSDQAEPWTGRERQLSADRRQRPEATFSLGYPLSEGWLVFKSDYEKRRLAPIPPDWEKCRGQELRNLWEQADIIAARIDEQSA